jgi:hypothetical protein
MKPLAANPVTSFTSTPSLLARLDSSQLMFKLGTSGPELEAAVKGDVMESSYTL